MQSRTIDIDLAAGVPQRRTIRGRYLRMWEAVGDVAVQVDGATAFMMEKGMGLPFAREFSELSFLSTTAQTIRIVVAVDRADDSRFNMAGAVEVIDGGRLRTDAGVAFMAGIMASATAATYASAYIVNLAASGVRCVINQLTINSAASVLAVGEVRQGVASALNNYGQNKKCGAPAGACYLVGQGESTLDVGMNRIIHTYASTSQTQFRMTEPVILLPGYMIKVQAGGVNVSLGLMAEWMEEAV